MGKKSRRVRTGDDFTPSRSALKAQREKAAIARDNEGRIRALAKKLQEDLQDVDVYTPPPPVSERDDCPLCFHPMQLNYELESSFMQCCGQTLCIACCNQKQHMCETKEEHGGRTVCAFCREVLSEPAEIICKRLERLVEEHKHLLAMHTLSGKYERGDGVPRDDGMSMQLLLRAAEQGRVEAYCDLAGRCWAGAGGAMQSVDLAMLFASAAAKRGDLVGQRLLGDYNDLHCKNTEQAIKHWSFAAKHGERTSLTYLRMKCDQGHVSRITLDEIEMSFKEALKEEWSKEGGSAFLLEEMKIKLFGTPY